MRDKPNRRRILLALLALLFVVLPGCQRNELRIPPEEANRKNPIHWTPESIAEGKHLYEATDCAICHGPQGDGRGADALAWRFNIHNWRNSSTLKGMSDGDLFYIILKGEEQMPGYEGQEDARDFWKMVNFIRSLSAQDSSTTLKSEHVDVSR